MLFEEIISLYSENHTTPIKTKCSFIDCWDRWDIKLPLGFEELSDSWVMELTQRYRPINSNSRGSANYEWKQFRKEMTVISVK
jgi:hypothetical protein